MRVLFRSGRRDHQNGTACGRTIHLSAGLLASPQCTVALQCEQQSLANLPEVGGAGLDYSPWMVEKKNQEFRITHLVASCGETRPRPD